LLEYVEITFIKGDLTMAVSHIRALQKKHDKIEARIHEELGHPARDEQVIKKLKVERLHIQEELERLTEH
jgi:hypothetical protein